METAGKQNFVWKKLAKTENGWHSGELRPKATSMRLRFLSVRTWIHCKRTSLAFPSLVNSMCDLNAVFVLNGYYWKIPMLWITVIWFISIFARYKLEIVGGMGPTVGMVSRLAINWSWFTSKQSQRNSESIQRWLSTGYSSDFYLTSTMEPRLLPYKEATLYNIYVALRYVTRFVPKWGCLRSTRQFRRYSSTQASL